MSFHTLLGAFPIRADGDSLEPLPNERVGELRSHSRGGSLFRAMRALLDGLPGHESLRFLADQGGTLPRRSTDPETRWTVLDARSMPGVIADLDRLLAACDQRADVVAGCDTFESDQLSANDIRRALALAQESATPNDATPSGEDGDTVEFMFNVFVSLRGLLRRAQAASMRVAVFTWAPS